MSTSPEALIGFRLWRLALAWQRQINRELKDLELTHVQFMALSGIDCLCQGDSCVSQAALAQHTGSDVMTTSSVVRTLERRDLVRRDQHPTDARARSLHLTPQGEGRLAEARPRVAELDSLLLPERDDSLSAALTNLSHRLRQAAER